MSISSFNGSESESAKHGVGKWVVEVWKSRVGGVGAGVWDMVV